MEGFPSGQRDQTVNLTALPSGSNPAPSKCDRGCSSMVEPQPSKLMVWVRFPSPAVWVLAHIAQAVEHFLGKEEVTGSSPVVGNTALAIDRVVEVSFRAYFLEACSLDVKVSKLAW